MGKFDTWKTGEKFSKRELNRQIEELERLGKYSVDGLDAVSDSSGLHLATPDSGFYAMLLTDTSDCGGLGYPYAWVEVSSDGSGGWTLLDSPRSGTEDQNPAYSTKGECIDSGSVVWLSYGVNEEMLFDDCCGSQDVQCAPFVADSSNNRTLSFSSGLVVGDSSCQNLTPENCVQYVTDVTCSGTTKTYTTKYLKWTSTGFQVCNASASSACGSCGAVQTCVPFVSSATCVGNDFVVDKKFWVWNDSGFTVEDESCPACCYTSTNAIADVGAALVDSNTVDFTATSSTITADVKKQMSITSTISGLMLTNDQTSPGNSMLYGTDGGGVKGWLSQPTLSLSVLDTSTIDLTLAASTLSAVVFDGSITPAKMNNGTALSVLGRSANSSGVRADIAATDASGGGVLIFNDSANTVGWLQDGTGDVVLVGKGVNATPIFGKIVTAYVTDGQITYAKIQTTSAAAVLLGRGAGSGSGAVQELSLGTGLSLSGTTLASSLSIADTGTIDLTLSGTTLSGIVIDDSITYSKMQNVSAASQLLGRGSAAGSGDPQEIAIGTSLAIVGTTLSCTLSGLSEASQANMEADTDSANYVSARRVHSSPGVAKCWAYVTQTTTPASISSSYGLSSITDNGVGDISYNFTTAFSGAGAFSFTTWGDISSGTPTNTPPMPNVTTYGTGTVEILWVNSAGTATDFQFSMVAFLGDQ